MHQRKGEILKVKWNQVKDGSIYLRETKTNEPRQIPINDEFATVFKIGHKDIKMTMRYAHLSQENKRKAINLLNELTTKMQCHKMSQIQLSSLQVLRSAT